MQAHDPAVRALPDELAARIRWASTAADALEGAAACWCVATEWPDYRAVDAETVASRMRVARVIDANRFLAASLAPTRA